MDKKTLDDLLEKYKVQPVGKTYAELIVPRAHCREFVTELVENAYKVDGVTWWERCEQETGSQYGLGGPKSIFYEAWFSEIPASADDFTFSEEMQKEEIIQEILKRIETKEIFFSKQTIKFNESNWLTPAICLDVPEDWRNTYNS